MLSMYKTNIKKLFQEIKVWKRGNERAPHKPLLLLYALGCCYKGENRKIFYSKIDIDLRKLFIEFAPNLKSIHTEYSFWRLQNDGLWVLYGAENVQPRKSNTDAKKSELLLYNVCGGFSENIYNELRNNSSLLIEIARDLLNAYFPTTVHKDILDRIGIDINSIIRK